MPELPEVETVKENLKNKLIGRKILATKIYYSNIIAYPKLQLFQEEIENKTIKTIERRGKWLVFDLDNYFLLSHLRMEGKYFLKGASSPLLKHEHIAFLLDDETKLIYHDVRKFGKMHLIPKDDINKIGPLKELGLEPWDKDLTIKYLKEKLGKKSLPIKTVLLDQSIITGIGNIYVNEILFLSRINPLKPSKSLTDKELQKIINNTRIVLEDAIKMGGTTIRSYTSVNGKEGSFQQNLYVHGKENKSCPICGDPIKKIKVGGRGTYYCPTCQK